MAQITNLILYGFATYGEYLYEKEIDRADTQMANVAARRISGAHRTARLEVLMPTAGLVSVRDVYIQQCGGMVIRAL